MDHGGMVVIFAKKQEKSVKKNYFRKKQTFIPGTYRAPET
jgi:hypothetical protein